MNSNKRPLSITVLASLYLAVGTLGFAYHFRELMMLQHDSVWAELTEFAALVCGVFMLRGHNWARWFALAWMTFHVLLGAFGAAREFIIHTLLCAVIAWILFRPKATRYFCNAESEPL